MVIVEKDRVDADVVSRRFALFVVVRADRRERGVAAVDVGAQKPDPLDRHRAPVVEHLEIAGGEIDDRLPGGVADDRVHLDQRRAAAKYRRLRGSRRGLLARVDSAHRRRNEHRNRTPAHRRDDNI